MTIHFSCPECGKQIAGPESLAGQERACPNCGNRIHIPAIDKAARKTVVQNDDETPPADHPLLLFPERSKDHGNLIDMTAMVDIVFFLLIFFLVTSMQSLEAVINLPTPDPSESASSNLQTVPTLADDPSVVVVTIDAEDAVWVEDEETFSEQDLRAKLRTARQQDERDSMLIKGSGDATHGKFVMVLDAAADAGMKEILFSVEDSDDVAEGG
jgi:biopolymer transport protein ExbD/DNA-directed RNA polymerase subunit RPC12/RpoP